MRGVWVFATALKVMQNFICNRFQNTEVNE